MNGETSFNSFSLSGRCILATGANSSLGLVVTQSCARMGAELIATGCDQIRLDGRLTTLQSTSELSHCAIQADLRIAEERATVAAAVDSEVHGLMHSAGISHLCPVRMTTEARLYEVQSINVDLPMLLIQTLFKRNLVAPDGSVPFITSITAHIGTAEVGACSGTKAALIAMSRCLAIEVVKRNTRVNCLSPSLVETSLLDAATQTIGPMDGQRGNHPIGFDKPGDTANAAIFMLSDVSHWITGTTLVMDGDLAIS